MSTPDLDVDITSTPRSREENQERAFIAASRRKDRSLDARLESANRASMLHKQRTGKALHITKEIVENEAMYEEVDERYQEKRIRMLQAQNLQIEEQFRRHLLAAFGNNNNHMVLNGANGGANNANIRRAPPTTAGMALHSTVQHNGVKKPSIDMSNNHRPSVTAVAMSAASRSSSSNGSVDHAYTTTPTPMSTTAPYSQSPQSSTSPSYMPSNFPPNFSLAPSPPLQPYAAVPPVWQQRSWSGSPQAVSPTSAQQQNYLNDAAQMWQRRQQALFPQNAAQTGQLRQFRDRVGSAPEINVQGLLSNMAPVGHHGRMPSEPVPGPSQDASFTVTSAGNTPKLDAHSTTDTPDHCSTPVPTTPVSLNAQIVNEAVDRNLPGKERETGIMVSSVEGLDPDFDEFSRFALGLETNALDPPMESFGFDDLVSFDDYATAA